MTSWSQQTPSNSNAQSSNINPTTPATTTNPATKPAVEPPKKVRPPIQPRFSTPSGTGETTYDKNKVPDLRTEEMTVTDKVRLKRRPRAIYAIFTVSYAHKRKKKVGRFKIKLYHNRARLTVENFINLVEGNIEWVDKKTEKKIKKPFYDGLKFHRIIRKFIMQTGDPDGNNKGGGPGYTIPLEISERLVHDRFGVVSMARQGNESHGSQFFITLAPVPHLDGTNTVFGQVVDGVEVIEEIEQVRTDREDFPRYPIIIQKASIERIF